MEKTKTAQERQQALDSISAEDLEKVKQHQAKTSGAYKVDNEWMLLAEFAMAYGWNAYIYAKSDLISTAEMMTLIEASRKLRAGELYDSAVANLIGSGSAMSKKPSVTFNSLTKNIISKSKADEL